MYIINKNKIKKALNTLNMNVSINELMEANVENINMQYKRIKNESNLDKSKLFNLEMSKDMLITFIMYYKLKLKNK